MKTQLQNERLTKDRLNFSVDDEKLKEAMKGYCCKNTAQSNKWTVKNFSQWYMERSKSMCLEDSSSSPLEVLLTDDASVLL